MARLFRSCLPYSLVRVLVVGGVLACIGGLVGTSADAMAVDVRTVQVWPDRNVGVVTGRLDGATAHLDTVALPFGVVSAASGGAVRGRTYLSLPLQVFPLATAALRATLYAYADSASNAGEARLGVYRVLHEWDSAFQSSNLGTWPVLLNVPVAVTGVRVGGPSLSSSSRDRLGAGSIFESTDTLAMGAWAASKADARPPGHAVPLPQQVAELYIDLATSEVSVGASTKVDIRVRDVGDLRRAEIVVEFDPTILEVVDAYPDVEGVQIEVGPFLNPESAVRNVVAPDRGEIEFSQEAIGPAVDGSGVLASITFRGKTPGKSAIGFANILLESSDGQDLEARGQSGSIAVVPGATDAGPTTPAASPAGNPPPSVTPGLVPTRVPPTRLVPTRVPPTRELVLTPTPPISPLGTPIPPAPPGTVVTMTEFAGIWITWDVTSLLRAWLSREVPNYGLAIASAPVPHAGPGTAGNLLLARWFTSGNPETVPYVIVEYQVLPVTPTPTATSPPVLPPAGHPSPSGGLAAVGLALVGLALLIVGLARRPR